MASDARDILNESVPTPPPPTTVLSSVKKTSKSKRKRPEGMNLELYQLLGQGQDPCPLVPTHAAHGGYKARARLSNNKTRSWKWSEFDNKARVDGLRLKHWAVQEQVWVLKNLKKNFKYFKKFFSSSSKRKRRRTLPISIVMCPFRSMTSVKRATIGVGKRRIIWCSCASSLIVASSLSTIGMMSSCMGSSEGISLN